jgi:hypothetical protein
MPHPDYYCCSFTPRRNREQAADDAQTKLRKMIAQRMREETVYCTNENFIEHYLPPIPETVDVDAIVEDFREAKYLQKPASHIQDLLGEFSVKPSEIKKKEGSKTNEKVIFAPLVNIATALRESVGASKNAFHLRMVPDTELKSEIRGCTFKIDACMTATRQAPGTLHLTDIVVPFEFKIYNDHTTTQEVDSPCS